MNMLSLRSSYIVTTSKHFSSKRQNCGCKMWPTNPQQQLGKTNINLWTSPFRKCG